MRSGRFPLALLALAAAVGLTACSSSGNAAPSAPAPASPSGTSPTSSVQRRPAPVTSKAPVGPPSRVPASGGSGGNSPTQTGPQGGPVPSGFTPLSVTFVSTATGWVLGTAPCSHQPCTSVVRTRDGGADWTGIPAPKATLGNPQSGREGQVSVLRFANESDGWAGVGGLYSTHDGGATWHEQHIGAKRSDVSSLATGGGYVYAVTDNCPSQGGSDCSNTVRVYASLIGQDSWRPVSGTVAGGAATVVVSGSDWFLPVLHGVLHGSGTAQATSRVDPCPAVEGSPTTPYLAIADPTHLDAACAGGGAAGSARFQFYGTTDGAQHWNKTGPSHVEPDYVGGLADNGANVLMLAASSGGSELLRSTDDAGHFDDAAVTTPGGGVPWADLGFTTAQRGVVVLQRRGLYLSSDAGQSWHRASF